MQPNHFALEFIDRCSRVSGLEALRAEVARCANLFGFDHFMLAVLPWPTGRFAQHVMANDWPKEWYDRYGERGYFHLDGVGQWALRTSQPFTYGEVPDALRLSRAARMVRAEASDFGLGYGILMPIRGACLRQSALSFSGAVRCDLGPQDRAALHLVAIYAESAASNTLAKSPAPEMLTSREREVLAWAAQGKSAWETSVILSVSERTVAKHLEHARTKLNAATTTQAVVEALRLGEIVL